MVNREQEIKDAQADVDRWLSDYKEAEHQFDFVERRLSKARERLELLEADAPRQMFETQK